MLGEFLVVLFLQEPMVDFRKKLFKESLKNRGNLEETCVGNFEATIGQILGNKYVDFI